MIRCMVNELHCLMVLPESGMHTFEKYPEISVKIMGIELFSRPSKLEYL